MLVAERSRIGDDFVDIVILASFDGAVVNTVSEILVRAQACYVL